MCHLPKPHQKNVIPAKRNIYWSYSNLDLFLELSSICLIFFVTERRRKPCALSNWFYGAIYILWLCVAQSCFAPNTSWNATIHTRFFFITCYTKNRQHSICSQYLSILWLYTHKSQTNNYIAYLSYSYMAVLYIYI